MKISTCTKAPSLLKNLQVLTTRNWCYQEASFIIPILIISFTPCLGLCSGTLSSSGRTQEQPFRVPVPFHRSQVRGCCSLRASGNTQSWNPVSMHGLRHNFPCPPSSLLACWSGYSQLAACYFTCCMFPFSSNMRSDSDFTFFVVSVDSCLSWLHCLDLYHPWSIRKKPKQGS